MFLSKLLLEVIYHTDNNVLLGDPIVSGQTILAELAMVHLINTQPNTKGLWSATGSILQHIYCLILFLCFENILCSFLHFIFVYLVSVVLPGIAMDFGDRITSHPTVELVGPL
ncbi:hypothetical protein MKX01_001986 [Papaver californicum]|nr:hypothetical protein MKX01_001986 [Papaver californicum]